MAAAPWRRGGFWEINSRYSISPAEPGSGLAYDQYAHHAVVPSAYLMPFCGATSCQRGMAASPPLCCMSPGSGAHTLHIAVALGRQFHFFFITSKYNTSLIRLILSLHQYFNFHLFCCLVIKMSFLQRWGWTVSFLFFSYNTKETYVVEMQF